MANNTFTKKQLEEIRKIGICLIVTASKNGQPHCTIVEPSKYSETEIVIPIVQMETSIDNIKENDKIFIHITKQNKESFGDSIQYKICAKANLEYEGMLFEEVKHFEESERLPEGWTVKGIVRAEVISVQRVEG